MTVQTYGSSCAAMPTLTSGSATVLKTAPQTSHVDGAETSFLDYMKKSYAERMEDAWLASHNLTREDLEAMPPEKRDAIKKAMAEDIKQRIKNAEKNKEQTTAVSL